MMLLHLTIQINDIPITEEEYLQGTPLIFDVI